MSIFQIASFAVPLLICLGIYNLIKTWIDAGVRERHEKLRVLEEALKNPALDRTVVDSLVVNLNQREDGWLGPNGRLMGIWLGIGWLTLFAGVGCLVAGGLMDDEDVMAGGVVAAVIGFGLVTYPFAVRELETRRAQS